MHVAKVVNSVRGRAKESNFSFWITNSGQTQTPACGAGVRSLQHLGVTGAELHGSSLVLSGGLSQGNVHC